jgi:hypothetical protein
VKDTFCARAWKDKDALHERIARLRNMDWSLQQYWERSLQDDDNLIMSANLRTLKLTALSFFTQSQKPAIFTKNYVTCNRGRASRDVTVDLETNTV